jgi:aspartate ammonia-lyase
MNNDFVLIATTGCLRIRRDNFEKRIDQDAYQGLALTLAAVNGSTILANANVENHNVNDLRGDYIVHVGDDVNYRR